MDTSLVIVGKYGERMNLRSLYKVLTVVVMGLVVAGLSSCMKDDGDEYVDLVAAVEALNAIPDSDGIILALDNNQLNNLQLGEYFLGGQVLSYRRVYPGNRLLRAFHPESVNENNAIFRSAVFFEPGKYYTLFVVETPEKKVEVLQVTDEVNAPAAGQAMIRFINVNPEGVALDFGIVTGSQYTMLATNIAFRNHTVFKAQDADREYDFFIRKSNSDEAPYVFKWNPKSQDIYTVWTNGRSSHGILIH